MNKKIIIDYILQYSWNIGFIEDPLCKIVSGESPMHIHWLQHDYTERWFADPFILDMDDVCIYVLVEDFVRKDKKAQISLLTVDRKSFRLLRIEPIIQESTHLSFPIYYRANDKIYIYPENGSSGVLKLYELNFVSRKCKYVDTIISKVLGDAVLTHINDEIYLVGTELPDMNGNELCFYRKTEEGFQFARKTQFEGCRARNAGDWFNFEQRIFRPAQDCTERYGSALEIQVLDPKTYCFKTVRRIEPTSKKYNLGIHTFNHFDGVSVVDGYCHDHPLLADAFYLLLSFKHGYKL